ncbi:hypothetical protein AVL55_17840 [Alteromonas macleodii]|uniref:Uncharacterized protein n=1 Tax=Alteromonas macleodii TaxID=28108 RepID=A0A126Q3M5_ALTMA|nr:hypothetical protein [Alteromonas macleodii]AMJ99853.1 hypothetical protein AVL55_17840 [Alteromonas macleodii]
MSIAITEQPNYAAYSIEELEDVLENIDKQAFPERYQAAKNELAAKQATLPPESDTDSAHQDEHFTRPKWSELHPITRISNGAFFVLIGAMFVSAFTDFIVIDAWLDNSNWAIALLTVVYIAFYYFTIFVDKRHAQYLTKDLRGKMTVVGMPLLAFFLCFSFIDKALPYTLHLASGKQETELKFAYEKGSGSKHCRHSLLLKESDTLSDGRLCLNQSEHKRLPNKGWVYVKGYESNFGFDIEGYRFR